MAAKEVRLVGEGGVEWTFDLPLSETFSDQVAKGLLKPADDESAAAVAGYLPEAAAAAQAADGDETDVTLGDRIDAVTSHAQANELGKELGFEFEDKTPGLAAKKQAMHEAAAAQAADGDETDQS